MDTNHAKTVLAHQLIVAAQAASVRKPTHVSHPTLEAIVEAMNAWGRTELVHYAGSSYRDDIAWRVCLAWLEDAKRTESECKAIAVQGTAYELTAEQIRAANPGML